MFNLASVEPVYTWDVTVFLQLNGAWDENKFNVTFKRYSLDELTDLSRDNTAQEDADGREKDRVKATLKDAVKGWRELMDGAEPVEFSPSALDSLLKITPARIALHKALLQSQATAKEKN